jgi:hypothetical protein
MRRGWAAPLEPDPGDGEPLSTDDRGQQDKTPLACTGEPG